MDGLVPEARIDPQTIPPGERFGAWREATAPLFSVTPIRGPAAFRAEVRAVLVDDLVFSLVRFDAQMFARPPRRRDEGESDHITIQLYRKGSIEGEVGRHPLRMDPRFVSIHDFAHPYVGRSSDAEVLGVVIPRHRLAARDHVYERRPVQSLPVDGGRGLALASALERVWRELPATRAAAAPALADELTALVDRVLAPGAEADDSLLAAAGLEGAMKRHVLERLDDPGLSVEEICQRFRASRATVYRHFESAGGVQRYIRDQRLTRCLHELARSEPRVGAVREVADRWGFSNPSHFHRLFRAAHGIAPTEAVDAAGRAARAEMVRAGTSVAEVVSRLRGWLTSP